MTRSVISIQSAVAYGHVGNSAAVFPLQRLGFEVWPVNTVFLSNHPGHGACRGHALELAQVREILKGVSERGAIASADALITGYLGDPSMGEAVLETARQLKQSGEGKLFACDPVMGDTGGFFVKAGIPDFFRDEALPLADVLTPNLFELGFLSGRPDVGQPGVALADVLAAAKSLIARGPAMVLVTSVETSAHPGEIGMLLVTAEEAWCVFTPKLDVRLNGTGDCLSALCLAHRLLGQAPRQMLERVAASMFGLVAATHRAGSAELLLIAAQNELVTPSRRFEATRL